MSFAVQDFNRISGEATVRRLADLDSAAIANLPDDIIGTIVNWSINDHVTFAFDALAPTDIHVVTSTPGDAPGLPVNNADPIVYLLHRDDANEYTLVAQDDNGADDGRNASLSYTIPAPGQYRLKFGGSITGDYVAVLSATDPDALGSFTTFNADFVSVSDQELLLTFPNKIVVTFDNTIDLRSVDPSDLQINGIPAGSFEILDGKTLAFDISNANSGDGLYTITLPADAIKSLRGVWNPALTLLFHIDASSPFVTASTIASGASVAPGPLVYQVTFSEPLGTSVLGPEDFILTSSEGLVFPATSLNYDPDISVATVTFDGLMETSYQLRIVSGSTGARDLFGNPLDGGPSFPLPSGDGLAGDDFVVDFIVDTESSPLPTPAVALQPTGGRIYKTEATALIGTDNDSDRFVIQLRAGQPFFAFATATSALAPRLQVFDPSGAEMFSGSASAGGTVLSAGLTAPIDGLYALVVSSADTSTGHYSVGAVLGAAPEMETAGGSSNDTLASAEELQFALVLPVSAHPQPTTSAAVVGLGGSADHFRFQVTAGRPISIAAEMTAAADSTVPDGLSLLADDGTLVAVGSKRAWENTRDILEFVPSHSGTMYVRIEAAPDTLYQLVVLDGAAMDVEPNDGITRAQPIQVATTVLGGIALGTARYEVDFSNGVGGPSLDQFTATGLWHVTNRHDGDPNGHAEPHFAYFGLDSSGDFNAGTVVGTLTSPPIDLRFGSTPTLSLKYRLDSEDGTTYDRAEVQVSTDDGLTFVTVADKSTHFSQASTWTSRDIDLSGFAGETIRIRFSFNSGDGIANTGFGWQIDDLSLSGTSDLRDYYSLPANVGDVLEVHAFAYESLGSQPVGELVPHLELIDPNGLVVATAANHLTYAVPAGGAGVYRTRIAGEGHGDYRLEFSGSSADADTPASLLISVPAHNQPLPAAPERIQLRFDQGLRIDSLQPADLVFADSRITTTGIEVIDGHTIAFVIDVPSDIQGAIEYSIAADALTDLQGTPIAGVYGTFIIDRVGPRIIDTTPSSQASAPFNSLKFIFNEPLDPDSVSTANVLEFIGPNGSNLLSAITNVLVTDSEVEVRFQPQTVRGDYTLTLGGNIADVIGNRLDQDQNGVGGESTDTFTRVISLQSPDLVPQVDSLSGNLMFGQTVTLNYTVTNIGDDPALERWFDRVYLSRDGVLDGNDLLLTTSPSSNLLGPLDAAGGPNSSYSRWVDVTLPLSTEYADGTYYLLVRADAGSSQPESNEANNVTSTTALTLTLPPLPDLVIEEVVVPTTALSGQPVPVRWRLANRGTGDFAGTITDQIRLSTDAVVGNDTLLANFPFTGLIPAGGYVEREQLVTLPIATEGERFLVLTTDVTAQVYEPFGENNNTTLSSAIAVTLAPLPNLQVTSVTPPTGAFSSQPTTVHYVVTNTGTGPTAAPIWYDAVFLSTDDILDPSDTYLGMQANPGFLALDGSYASSITVTLPRGISGDYQLLVVTDYNNHVFENLGESDNATASPVFSVTLTPPADLQVQSVTGPFSAFSGAPANVSYTIENAGDGRTLEASWYDDVFLSTDQTLDASDVRVGRFLHSGALNAGATYSVIMQPVDLPIGIEGDYYFIVVTDTFNQVYENIFEGNNVAASSASTNVRLTPPPDLVPTFDTLPTSLSAGRSFETAFTVTNWGITPTVEHNWRDYLYLSSDPVLDATDTLLQSKTHYGNLGVFQSYSETFAPVIPWTITPGNYFLILATDADDRVFEIENDNNVVVTTAAIPLTIEAPDLITTSLNAPAAILAGQPFTASWTVSNQGIGSTTISRRDELVLSADTVLGNADDVVLKSVTVGGPLAAGTSQTVNAENVIVPLSSVSGSYHLFVRTDAGSAQFESNEANNSFGPTLLAVTQNLPDVIAENVTFHPQSSTSQGQLTVNWTTRNIGAAATNVGYWVDRVYLSADNTWSPDDRLLGALSQNAVLAPGQSRDRQTVLNLPAEVSGDFYVIVVSDATNQVVEGPGEANNTTASASLVNVSLNPTPDLRVTAVDAPIEAFSGQSLVLAWTVANTGAATAGGNWYDAVYLSSDQVLDRSSDIYLGYRNRPESLAAAGLASGQAYSQTASFEIPLGVAGPFYVFVATDSGNTVFERSGELNNAGYDSTLTTITLLPPADLVVGSITIPPDTQAGARVNLSYTVRNQGVNPARGSWQDSLYLSSDGVFSLDDWLLGTVSRSGDVPGFGGEYSATLSARLPGVLPGDYQIIVRSDIRNAIIESDEANNLSASLDAFAIDLPRLELEVPATGQLSAGESLFWAIDLTAGDSVRFSLDNASPDSTSEIYLRRGGVPSRSQYDFAANVPFTNDPFVVIPVEESGTYYVMAYGETSAANREFSLLAEVIPLSIFDVRTQTIGDSGSATVKVSGARFDQQTQFSLVDPADPTKILPAAGVLIQDSVTAFVTFNTVDFGHGTYTLVTQQDGMLASLPSAVTITQTVVGDVLVTIDGAQEVLPNRFNPFRIQYTNDGNTDFSAPLFIVENPNQLPIGFTTTDATEQPLHLFAVPPDGDSSVLRPGPIGSIPVVFRTPMSGDVNFPIRPIRANDPRVISEAEWQQIAAAIRPLDWELPQWNAFWSRIQPRIGTTWGSYVRFVQDLYTRTQDLNVRKGDVREMLRAVYEDEPEWRPNSIFSGQLLMSDQPESPVADVPIAAYRVSGDMSELYGSTVTAADGSFQFAALPPGEYVFAVDLDGYFFDTDRDGVVDNEAPRTLVQTSDIENFTLYVAAEPEPVVSQEQPSVVVDSSGLTHIVWLANRQLWHAVADASGEFTGAQAIAGASGSDPVIVAGDRLVNGGPGLMVVYRSGNADDAELLYVLGKLNAAGTAYLWSAPVAMTDDSVHDGGFDVGVASDGLPVVLSQRLSIGDEFSGSDDDADIYSWSQTPTGDFEAALLAALEAALADDPDLQVEGGSVRFRLQNFGIGPLNIPKWVLRGF